MIRQHGKLTFLSFLLVVLCGNTFAQKIPVIPLDLDSLITVGYATGSLKTLSGSVEKITEKQMNKDQVTNPLEAIRGRVPGLTIQRGTNGPAALDAVRLRGTTSLTSGNDPLIIVDGVFGDLSMLTSIYPTDIESFTILKDASETAQYGSRGASGVIEVTTKKGMQGRTQVAYNGSFGISTVYKNLKMLSGDEFRSVASERGISILDKGNNTNFQKEIQQTGLQQNHHVAFYGGSSTSSYRVSLGFMDRQGVILNEDMKNFTSNMNMNQKMFDGFFDCELGMFGSILKNHNLVDYQKTFYSAATFNPTYPNHKDPVTNSWDGITTASQITNPLAWMQVDDDDATSHISTHARFTFNLMKELKLVLFGAHTYNIVENSQYLPTSVWANGQAYKGTKKMESLLGNMMLTYKKGWKKHFFDVLALAELQKETYTGYYTTVSNFSTDKFGYNNLQAGAVRLWEGTNSYYEQPRLASFMGRFNYTYADRYVLTLNARTDASSKFGANHKWGFFPSASVGWMLTNEEFMNPLKKVLNEFKIRASWGELGDLSAASQYYANNEQYYFQSGYQYPGTPMNFGDRTIYGLNPTLNPNPDFTWATSSMINAGVDFKLWNGLLSGSADVFYRQRKGLPAQKANDNAGALATWYNLDHDNTRGFEFSLNHQYKIGEVNYFVGGNMSWSRTRKGNIEHGRFTSGYDEWKWNTEGHWNNVRWGYNCIGHYQSYGEIANAPMHNNSNNNSAILPGDLKYEDWNGDGYIDNYDQRPIGRNAYPELVYGINLGLSWKGVDFSMFWQGGALSDFQIGAFDMDAFQEGATNLNTWEYFGDRWHRADYTDPNSEWIPGYFPAVRDFTSVTINRLSSNFWMWNGSYIRLKNVELGYTLPQRITQKANIKQLRIYANLYNCLTFSSQKFFDPEQLESQYSFASYPQIMSFNVGINLKF